MEAQISKPKAPAPPDPVATAAAQTATNIGTAVANTASGQVNQYTPQGSLTYQQRGTHTYVDPTSGKTHEIPLWSAYTTLSPEQQKIQDKSVAAQYGLASAAEKAASFLPGYLGNVEKFDTSAIEGRLDELGRARLDPRFAREGEALRARLVNSGIREGSDAWNSEMRRMDEAKNDAYNQLYLTGRGQAFNELAAARNQPINEITALLSGSQVQNPNVAMATPDKMATTDYAGIVNQDYANRMGAYNAKMNQWNSTMGGLFSLGGSLGGAAIMSDPDAKENVEPVGQTFVPVNVYEYNYKGDDPTNRHRGVMADEVPPDMTMTRPDGMRMVDYSRLRQMPLMMGAAA